MAQARRVSWKSSVKQLFTKLWVGRMKGSQQGVVTHGKPWPSRSLRGRAASGHWGPQRAAVGITVSAGEGYLTAIRKRTQPCPPVIQTEGSQDDGHLPFPLLLPFDLLPVPRAGWTTLEPEGKQAVGRKVFHCTERGGEDTGDTQHTKTFFFLRHLS